jgi:hypothetical protein
MKRTPIARKTPLRATAFKPKKKEPKPFPIADPQQRAQQSSFKQRARKKKPGDDKRMRDACRSEPCYLLIPGVCNGDWRTCVPAHRNEGKGAGLKNADFFTLPACFTCHHEFDQGKRFLRQEKRDMWNAAFERWQQDRAAKMGIPTEELETA